MKDTKLGYFLSLLFMFSCTAADFDQSGLTAKGKKRKFQVITLDETNHNTAGEKASDSNEGIPGYLTDPEAINLAKTSSDQFVIEGLTGAVGGLTPDRSGYIAIWFISRKDFENGKQNNKPIFSQFQRATSVRADGSFSTRILLLTDGIIAISVENSPPEETSRLIDLNLLGTRWAFADSQYDDNFRSVERVILPNDVVDPVTEEVPSTTEETRKYKIRTVTRECDRCETDDDVYLTIVGDQNSAVVFLNEGQKEAFATQSTFDIKPTLANLGNIVEVTIEVRGNDSWHFDSLSITDYSTDLKTRFQDQDKRIALDETPTHTVVPTEVTKTNSDSSGGGRR